jgi:RimJ/RimL family protein N-acetyltransferase
MMIKGKKVILRKAQRKDFSLLYKWINDPEMASFWYGRDKPRSKNWVKKHFTPMVQGKDKSQCWIIEVSKQPIGFMYNTPQKEDDDTRFSGRVELDIMIGEKSEWRKGYGSDALKAMTRYAFIKQKAERVFIIPRVSNSRAIHVYEKVGFKKEGILRHYEKFEGKWIDCLMMSILKDEFKK